MTRARAVVIGAAWMYGAQLATITAQFVYAAITSRHVNDSGFGSYAIALSVSSFVGLLANGGLGQTAARLQTVDRETLRSLLTFAIILGLSAAGLLLVTANLWSWLWGAPDAAAPIRWCAIGAFAAPILGLASGLLRRQGRFRSLAVATTATNILGFLVGATAVIAIRSASSLLISPLVAQVTLTAVALGLSRRDLLGVASLRAARSHLVFSTQVTVQNLGSWFTGNIGPWTVSRAFTPAILGQWNRADVLTTVPFLQVQTAMLQAIYPEFRHDIDGPSRARHVWPDLLGLVAWLTLPLAGAATVLVPAIVPLVFGHGWALAATFSSALAAIAAVRALRALLGGAVEALGRYAWVWSAIGIEFAFAAAGAYAAATTRNIWLLFLGIGAGMLSAHLAQTIACGRNGYLNLRLLARHYAGATAGGLVTAGATWLTISAAVNVQRSPLLVAIGGVVVIGLAVALWRWRKRLPPVLIIQKYDLMRRH